MAASYDFKVDQGATFDRRLTWKDGDGTPIDLTGWTARMQVRRRMTDTDELAELTTENGKIALGGLNGTISLTLSDDDTDLLPAPGRFFYDLELISSGGQVTRLLQGRFITSPEVTR